MVVLRKRKKGAARFRLVSVIFHILFLAQAVSTYRVPREFGCIFLLKLYNEIASFRPLVLRASIIGFSRDALKINAKSFGENLLIVLHPE